MISLQFEIFVKLFSRRVLPCAASLTSGREAADNLTCSLPGRSQLSREPLSHRPSGAASQKTRSKTGSRGVWLPSRTQFLCFTFTVLMVPVNALSQGS